MADFSNSLEQSRDTQTTVVGIFTNSIPQSYYNRWVRFLQEHGFVPMLYIGLFTLPEGQTSTAHAGVIHDIAKAVAITVFLLDSSEITDAKNWIVKALENAERWNSHARRELFYCSNVNAGGSISEPLKMNAHAIRIVQSEDEMCACLKEMIAGL